MGAIKSTGLTAAGIRSELFEQMRMKVSHFAALSTRIESNKDSETYKRFGTVPQVREWGTGRKTQGQIVESYNVANLKYELTLEVDRDEIDDDQTGQIRIRIGEMATRAATHKDYLIGQLLINGGTSGYNSYDGVSFFNDAHVSGASGSQDNDLAPAASDADAPTTDEFKRALATAIEVMMAYRDDQGEPAADSVSGLACIVPPNMYFTALEAVNASVISTTSNVLVGVANVTSFPYLTATDTFYLAKTDGYIRPFMFQDRAPWEYNALVEDSEEGFKREKYLYGLRARYRMTYGEWRFCIRNVFAAS